MKRIIIIIAIFLGLVACENKQKQCEADKTYLTNQIKENQTQQSILVSDISRLTNENIKMNTELIDARGLRRERLLESIAINNKNIDSKTKQANDLKKQETELKSKLNNLNC